MKKIIIYIIIAIICIIAIVIGISTQIFKEEEELSTSNLVSGDTTESSDFDDLFDNTINYQSYSVSNVSKIDQTQDIVYTSYTLNEIYEGKYEIRVNIPVININNSTIEGINEEITSIFQEKVNSILSDTSETNQIYTVTYTAYVNENILSLVIKSTLKEDSNAQRVIIKAYTYNLSTNKEISLEEMLEIKNIDVTYVETKIIETIQSSINYADNLIALGYDIYERDINSSIYKVENSDNYFLGPNGTIYIIYAYGNSNYTSEKDVVMIN